MVIITLARKPLAGSVSETVLKHDAGGLNIDASRIKVSQEERKEYDNNMACHERYGDKNRDKLGGYDGGWKVDPDKINNVGARWPANVLVDLSCTNILDEQSGNCPGWSSQNHNKFNIYTGQSYYNSTTLRTGFFQGYNDFGGASRFFKVIKE